MGKTDTTGTYVYATDGASPGAPILRDGHAIYTPGLSENRGGVATFYSFDKLGNMWTLDGTSQNQTYYQDGTTFGSLFALSGSNPGGFGFSGGNGCQTDADTGLVLMGHRYYDPRVGRFISQDPAGDGDNWYAYADNSPTNEIDPGGLVAQGGFFQDPNESDIGYDPNNAVSNQHMQDHPGEYARAVSVASYYAEGARIMAKLTPTREADLAGCAPGARSGEVADGPRNPLLYHK